MAHSLGFEISRSERLGLADVAIVGLFFLRERDFTIVYNMSLCKGKEQTVRNFLNCMGLAIRHNVAFSELGSQASAASHEGVELLASQQGRSG